MGIRLRLLRRRPLTAAGLFGLIACTAFISYLVARYFIPKGTAGAEVGTDLSLTLALLAVILTGLQLMAALGILQSARQPSREELTLAARQLAAQVKQEWARTIQRLLADVGSPRPANLQYTRADHTYAMNCGLLRWRADGGRCHGSLADVSNYYASLNRGRLVVLGAPGAGKTVLAIQLLLECITALPEESSHSPLRIPVMLSLPSWRVPDLEADDQELSRQLDGWISRTVVETYRVSERIATSLVAGGWILPILDGLDEMDADEVEPASGNLLSSLPRATAVVRALNQDPGIGLRRVVLTSREYRYRQLLVSGSKLPVASFLQDASVIIVQPLTPGQVIDYMIYRFPVLPIEDRQPTPVRLEPRWAPVQDELVNEPNGVLAMMLSTPWRLFSAVTAYDNPSTCPRELVNIAHSRPDTLNELLLDKLIPAVMEQHPVPSRTRCKPLDVIRWLQTLAVHLAWKRNHGLSGTDLYLDEIWMISGSRAPRDLHAALVATIVAVGCAVAISLDRQVVKGYFPFDSSMLLSCAAIVLTTAGIARRAHIAPRRNDYRRVIRPGKRGLRVLASDIMLGIVSGLFGAAMLGLVFALLGMILSLATGRPSAAGLGNLILLGPAIGLIPGFILGVAFGFTSLVGDYPQALVRPSTLFREDLVSRLLDVFIGAFAVGGVIGFEAASGRPSVAIGIAYGFSFGPVGAFAGVLSSYTIDRYGGFIRSGFMAARRIVALGLVGVVALYVIGVIFIIRNGPDYKGVAPAVAFSASSVLMLWVGITVIRAAVSAFYSLTLGGRDNFRKSLVVGVLEILFLAALGPLAIFWIIRFGVTLSADLQVVIGVNGVTGPVLGGYVGVAAFTFAVGLAGVLALSSWTRCRIATMLAAHRQALPSRLDVFLDWAYDAGLLKLSGLACQFRHLEIQQWLTGQHSQLSR